MILSRSPLPIVFACLLFAPLPAHAAATASQASPFLFSPSALAPAPARGWVVLLPGENEFAFNALEPHYEKMALLLNANGFDTLIVPYDEAYDEGLDGDPDADGDRIAAVTLRALHWMHATHPETDGEPGAMIAWAEGARGLWSLVATGSKYPLVNLVAAAAFYPAVDDETPFNSRLPVLVQEGAQDDGEKTLRRYLAMRVPGSVEPELVVHDGAARGFDVDLFAKPKTIRSLPLIGTSTTLAYNAPAAYTAGQKMLAFLKARLEAPE